MLQTGNDPAPRPPRSDPRALGGHGGVAGEAPRQRRRAPIQRAQQHESHPGLASLCSSFGDGSIAPHAPENHSASKLSMQPLGRSALRAPSSPTVPAAPSFDGGANLG